MLIPAEETRKRRHSLWNEIEESECMLRSANGYQGAHIMVELCCSVGGGGFEVAH